MGKKILLSCIVFSIVLLSLPANGYSAGDIIPKGRVKITDFDVPNMVNAGEPFSINVTIKNDRFLPVKLKLRADLLDGLLEFIKKSTGEEPIFTCPGRTTTTIQIDCVIRDGDIDWYKEEYNIQAVLFQKIPLIGWISRGFSTVQGIHVKSRLGEKDNVRILSIKAPEIIDEDATTFDVSITVSNEGSFDFSIWTSVDMVEKPSILPGLEQYNLLRGLASERKELGRSNEETIKPGETKTIHISCELRETEANKERFNIEAVLFVNFNGQHFQVDTSTMQGIYHEQSFLEQNYLLIIAAVFGVLIALAIIVFIIRILYPSYYIKRIKLKEEKKRIKRLDSDE